MQLTRMPEGPTSFASALVSPIMPAFAAALKIDSFAYMQVQDFGNAFGTSSAQNSGANNT